ncbi:hypothetical protein C8R44DRAFT_866120 [Mycena epipterygia]|nr:hypothetical protein C8R44DRAFT_866120 [Mycena epipterygia]
MASAEEPRKPDNGKSKAIPPQPLPPRIIQIRSASVSGQEKPVLGRLCLHAYGLFFASQHSCTPVPSRSIWSAHPSNPFLVPYLFSSAGPAPLAERSFPPIEAVNSGSGGALRGSPLASTPLTSSKTPTEESELSNHRSSVANENLECGRDPPPHLDNESVTVAIRRAHGEEELFDKFFTLAGRAIDLYNEPLDASVSRFHSFDAEEEDNDPLLYYGAVDGLVPGKDDAASMSLRDAVIHYQHPLCNFLWTRLSEAITSIVEMDAGTIEVAITEDPVSQDLFYNLNLHALTTVTHAVFAVQQILEALTNFLGKKPSSSFVFDPWFAFLYMLETSCSESNTRFALTMLQPSEDVSSVDSTISEVREQYGRVPPMQELYCMLARKEYGLRASLINVYAHQTAVNSLSTVETPDPCPYKFRCHTVVPTIREMEGPMSAISIAAPSGPSGYMGPLPGVHFAHSIIGPIRGPVALVQLSVPQMLGPQILRTGIRFKAVAWAMAEEAATEMTMEVAGLAETVIGVMGGATEVDGMVETEAAGTEAGIAEVAVAAAVEAAVEAAAAALVQQLHRHFLTAEWLKDRTQEFEEMKFRQRGHEKEKPKEFFQRGINYHGFIFEDFLDGPKAVSRILHTQPTEWNSKINPSTCTKTTILLQEAKHQRKTLMGDWEFARLVNSVATARPGTSSSSRPSDFYYRCHANTADHSRRDEDYSESESNSEEDEGRSCHGHTHAADTRRSDNRRGGSGDKRNDPPRTIPTGPKPPWPKGATVERYEFSFNDSILSVRPPNSACFICTSPKHVALDCPHRSRWQALRSANLIHVDFDIGDEMKEYTEDLAMVTEYRAEGGVDVYLSDTKSLEPEKKKIFLVDARRTDLPSYTLESGVKVLQARKSRQLPDRLGSLGARALHVKVKVGSLDQEEVRGQMDSGADITLMSEVSACLGMGNSSAMVTAFSFW